MWAVAPLSSINRNCEHDCESSDVDVGIEVALWCVVTQLCWSLEDRRGGLLVDGRASRDEWRLYEAVTLQIPC